MIDPLLLIIVAAIVVIIVAVVRIVPDHARYAVFKSGTFLELKGPGILGKLPGTSQKWVRVSVGDRADMIDAHLAIINGASIPIEVEEGDSSGVGMRISGFRENKVVVGRVEA